MRAGPWEVWMDTGRVHSYCWLSQTAQASFSKQPVVLEDKGEGKREAWGGPQFNCLQRFLQTFVRVRKTMLMELVNTKLLYR